MSIFVTPFHHASCHIPKISMDEVHARLDILILFIDKPVFVMSLLRGASNFDESLSTLLPKPRHCKNKRRATIGDLNVH